MVPAEALSGFEGRAKFHGLLGRVAKEAAQDRKMLRLLKEAADMGMPQAEAMAQLEAMGFEKEAILQHVGKIWGAAKFLGRGISKTLGKARQGVASYGKRSYATVKGQGASARMAQSRSASKMFKPWTREGATWSLGVPFGASMLLGKQGPSAAAASTLGVEGAVRPWGARMGMGR